MEIDSADDSNDMGGLSDNEVDIEIETANRMANKRPAEETKEESGIRPKSPRFDDVVSPATITDSLELKANIDFWFETNESKTNPGLNTNYFMTKLINFCNEKKGYITGSIALAIAMDTLEINRNYGGDVAASELAPPPAIGSKVIINMLNKRTRRLERKHARVMEIDPYRGLIEFRYDGGSHTIIRQWPEERDNIQVVNAARWDPTLLSQWSNTVAQKKKWTHTIEEGSSLDIVFVVPRGGGDGRSLTVDSITESFRTNFTIANKYLKDVTEYKTQITWLEDSLQFYEREISQTIENINILSEREGEEPDENISRVLDSLINRNTRLTNEKDQKISKLKWLQKKLAQSGQYCNGKMLHYDEDSDSFCVTQTFFPISDDVTIDVQLIFYYERNLLPDENQKLSQYEDEESRKRLMEKILIDDALTKIYDYRMLQCYLDFEDKDTPLINFSNQNCKNDIIDKRLIIVNNNNSQDYKSCQKSIIQSIKYYEKGFIPKSIQKPWRRASSPRANAMFLDQEEREVDNQIIENELTNFIESQRYRLYCSIMRTSDNILEMRYPHIYTTIEPTGDIDVYDATQIEKLRNDCINKWGLVRSDENNGDEIYKLPDNIPRTTHIGLVSVKIFESFGDQGLRGWNAQFERYYKIGDYPFDDENIRIKVGNREWNKQHFESKLLFPKNLIHIPNIKDFGKGKSFLETIPKTLSDFINELSKTNDKLIYKDGADEVRGIMNWYPQIKLFRDLHYFYFNPTILNNKITILVNRQDDEYEKSLCKTVTSVKHFKNWRTKRDQILRISTDNRSGNTPMQSLDSLDEVFKPFTDFFKTQDQKLRPSSGGLPYLQTFAEQYDLSMNDTDSFYMDANTWPSDFFEEDDDEADDGRSKIPRQYEFFLPNNENIDATDVIDHGGILKRFFTGLIKDFKLLVKTSIENNIKFNNDEDVLRRATHPKGKRNLILRSRDEVDEDGDRYHDWENWKHFTEYPYETMLLIILKFAINHKAQQIIKIDDDLLNMIFNTVNEKIPYTKIIWASGVISKPVFVGRDANINIQLICRLLQESGCKEYERYDLEGYNDLFTPNKLSFEKNIDLLPPSQKHQKLCFTPLGKQISGNFDTDHEDGDEPEDEYLRQILRGILPPKKEVPLPNTLTLISNQFVGNSEYTIETFQLRLIKFFDNIIRIRFWDDAHKNLMGGVPPRAFIHTQDYSWEIYKFLLPSFETIKINSIYGKNYIKSIIKLNEDNHGNIEGSLNWQSVNIAFQGMTPNQRLELANAISINDDDLEHYILRARFITETNEFQNLYNIVQRISSYRLPISREDIYNITKINMDQYLNDLSIDDEQRPNLEDFIQFVTNTNGLPDNIKYSLDPNSSSPVRQDVTRYPASHTCWNELELPWYIDISDQRYSYENFKELLDNTILNQVNIWRTNLQHSENVEMQDDRVDHDDVDDEEVFEPPAEESSSDAEEEAIIPTTGGNKNDKRLLRYVGYW